MFVSSEHSKCYMQFCLGVLNSVLYFFVEVCFQFYTASYIFHLVDRHFLEVETPLKKQLLELLITELLTRKRPLIKRHQSSLYINKNLCEGGTSLKQTQKTIKPNVTVQCFSFSH